MSPVASQLGVHAYGLTMGEKLPSEPPQTVRSAYRKRVRTDLDKLGNDDAEGATAAETLREIEELTGELAIVIGSEEAASVERDELERAAANLTERANALRAHRAKKA